MSKLGKQTMSKFPSVSEQREHQERMREALAAGKRRMFLESGPLLRARVHDDGCPCCGIRAGTPFLGRRQDGSLEALPWVPIKQHCLGRDPMGAEEDPDCYIAGGHIHARCPACNFFWFERMANDESELDGVGLLPPGMRLRGGIHGPDHLRAGVSFEYEPPDLKSLWNWQSAEDQQRELVASLGVEP